MKILLTAAFALLAPALFAAEDHLAHSATVSTTETETQAQSSATTAFIAANAKMHSGMNTAYTGDADLDFITGMVPHHQGAIDTAKIVIKYGTDPEVKMFANDIIKAQTKEIEWMRDWLELHGPNPARASAPQAVNSIATIESQSKEAQQKVAEIEQRIESQPVMPMREKPMLRVIDTPISSTNLNKATTVAEDMAKQDTQKLMKSVAESAVETSPTTKPLPEKLNEINQPLSHISDEMEESPTTFRQPGMSY